MGVEILIIKIDICFGSTDNTEESSGINDER